MPAGDILAIRPFIKAGDQLGLNVLHYQNRIVVAPEPSLNDIAAAMDAIFRPLYVNLIGNNADFQAIGVQKIRPLPLSLQVFSVPAPTSGAGGASLLPRQVCGLIAKRTVFAGRRFRGRVYVPFPTEEQSDPMGVPTVAYLATLNALAAALPVNRVVTVGPGSVTLVPVIFHGNFTPNFTDIDSALIRAKWATQRRRGSFGRVNPE